MITVRSLVAVFLTIAIFTACTERSSRMQNEISEHPTYRALKGHRPEIYDEIIAIAARADAGDLTATSARRQIRARIMPLIESGMPYGSDETVIEYSQLIVDQLRAFRDAGGNLCFRSMFDTVNAGPDIVAALPPSMIQRELDVQRRMYDSYDDSRRIPGEEWAMAKMEPVYEVIFGQHGDDAFEAYLEPTSPHIDKQKACDVSITLYSEILKMPDADAVGILRWLLTG